MQGHYNVGRSTIKGNIMLRIRHASLLLWALCLAGCAAYVNVPALTGDTADHNPNGEYAVPAIPVAIKAALGDQPIDHPFLVVLPKGAAEATYNLVLAQVGPNATWVGPDAAGPTTAPAPGGGVMLITPTAAPLPSDRAVIEVAQIRIRGWSGQIDVVRPTDLSQIHGSRELVTVYMKWDPVSHWQSVLVRPWRTIVETALKMSADAGEP